MLPLSVAASDSVFLLLRELMDLKVSTYPWHLLNFLKTNVNKTLPLIVLYLRVAPLLVV